LSFLHSRKSKKQYFRIPNLNNFYQKKFRCTKISTKKSSKRASQKNKNERTKEDFKKHQNFRKEFHWAGNTPPPPKKRKEKATAKRLRTLSNNRINRTRAKKSTAPMLLCRA
jgi:hypothetical protein